MRIIKIKRENPSLSLSLSYINNTNSALILLILLILLISFDIMYYISFKKITKVPDIDNRF